MLLLLNSELCKAEKAKSSEPKQKADAGKPVDASSSKKGEQRGGSYVARVQSGYEKDGSPQYRYFHTEEEYEAYLRGKGKSPSAKQLEAKVNKEHKESKDKATGRLAVDDRTNKKARKKLLKSENVLLVLSNPTGASHE